MDWDNLKQIKRLCKQKQYAVAMGVARNTDTIVREEIPTDLWIKMGGRLTKIGLEKLRKLQAKKKNK